MFDTPATRSSRRPPSDSTGGTESGRASISELFLGAVVLVVGRDARRRRPKTRSTGT